MHRVDRCRQRGRADRGAISRRRGRRPPVPGRSASFDTPLDGTTGVTGSIAVTGWALDDVGIARVRILRDPVAGEGSRADLHRQRGPRRRRAARRRRRRTQRRRSTTRAGWGYLLLTQLPAEPGQRHLHAARDRGRRRWPHDDARQRRRSPAPTRRRPSRSARSTRRRRGRRSAGGTTSAGFSRAAPGAPIRRAANVHGRRRRRLPARVARGWNARRSLGAVPGSTYPGIDRAQGVFGQHDDADQRRAHDRVGGEPTTGGRRHRQPVLHDRQQAARPASPGRATRRSDHAPRRRPGSSPASASDAQAPR